MNNPTEEQIKKFWEWFGFKFIETPVIDAGGQLVICKSSWLNGVETSLPDLDLNNLFKYAVPRLFELKITVGITCSAKYKDYNSRLYDMNNNILSDCPEMSDPALALFWAIYKFAEGKEQYEIFSKKKT